MIQHCPTPTELDDLELLVSGAYAPLTRFNEPGQRRHPRPARRRATRGASWSTPRACRWPGSRPTAALEPLTHAQYGPFRRLHLTPAAGARAARRCHVRPGRRRAHRRRPRRAARTRAAWCWSPSTGTGTAALSPVALVRATLAAADLLDDASVVAVPLAVPRRRRRRPRARRAGAGDLRRPATRSTALRRRRRLRPLPRRRSRRSSTRTSPSPRSRGSCCSSPGSPAAASPRSPAP